MISIDLAWAAGLFEGEGSLSVLGKARQPRARITSTDFDVILRFRKIIGFGCLREEPPVHKHHLRQLAWYVGNAKEVRELIALLWPWFGERRRKRALIVLARCQEIHTARKAWYA